MNAKYSQYFGKEICLRNAATGIDYVIQVYLRDSKDDGKGAGMIQGCVHSTTLYRTPK